MTVDVDVVVVGAGLSGLACATALEQAGVSTLVLEARDRVGGRTLNAAIGDGQVVELAGQYVGPAHREIITLAQDLGIDTFPTHVTGDSLLLCEGTLSRFPGTVPRGGADWYADFAHAQQRLEQMARHVAQPGAWRSLEYARWDTHTPASWMDEHMSTDTGRAVMGMVIEAILGASPQDVSLLQVVLYIRAGGCSLDALIGTTDAAQQDRFVGGSQEIALRMATRLGDHVRLSSPVTAIEHTEHSVRAVTDTGRITAQYAVVAVPPVLTATIRFEPALPGQRMQLAQRLVPGTVIKYIAVYDQPFWRTVGLTGIAWATEGPIKVVFDNSPPTGRVGALLGFALGRDAHHLARHPAPDRRRLVLARLVELFGPEAGTPGDFLEKDWTADPWTRGGYAGHFGPGGWSTFGGSLRTPAGRIHWAGSETATGWAGSMNGAITAGRRVATTVTTHLTAQPSRSPL